MKHWMVMGSLFAATLTGAVGQQSGVDLNFGMPKLEPKPPTSGSLTVTPTPVTPAGTTPATVNPTQLQVPGEWKVTSNTIASVEFSAPPVNNPPAPSQWDNKQSAVTTPPLTLAPRPQPVLASTTNNPWQQTQKTSPLATPPPSPWDAKPGKDPWK